MPRAHFSAQVISAVGHKFASLDHCNLALSLRLRAAVLVVVLGTGISSCGSYEPSKKMNIADQRHIAFDARSPALEDKGSKVSIGTVRQAPRSVEELQVKPPDGLKISPAAKGEIRIFPDSRICMARFISKPLQQRLQIHPNTGLGGPIGGAFDRIMIANHIPRAIRGASRRPVIRSSDDLAKVQWYLKECRWNAENIYVDLVLSMNQNKEPYQFALTVRQNNRALRHIVSRTPNTLHPSNFVNSYLRNNENAKIMGSIISDILDATKLIEDYVSGGQNE